MSIIQGSAHTSAGGYNIERSLRFNSADTAYLTRTQGASATDKKKGTLSFWVKLCAFGADNVVYDTSGTSDTTRAIVYFDTNNKLVIFGNSVSWRTTTQVFRDPSAWYHVVVVADTTQATANNRVRLYVNGSEVTAFGTTNNPTQNNDFGFGYNGSIWLGRYAGAAAYSNIYLTEVNFIDGSALTPSSFGQTNSATGVWEPAAYTGTYGTNGFYLKFADNSGTTSTTLGKDSSGNGNNWTPNNFSVTAGAGNDSLVDTPTSYGTDTGLGGEVRGNYCTWNPLNFKTNQSTITNGNLTGTSPTGTGGNFATINFPTSGKWYYEQTPTSGSNFWIGISDTTKASAYTTDVLYYFDGDKYINNTPSAYGASFTTNDVIGIAVNCDSNEITFYKNGSSQGTISYTLNTGNFAALLTDGASLSTATYDVNFGQRPFAYTAPSGFKALCTQNLPTPTIGATSTTQAGKYMNVALYTGTGSSLSVTGVGFQPDLVWIKSRSNAQDHKLTDAVRGTTKALISNTTGAETTDTNGLTAFGSDGFTVGTDATYNTNTYTYVAWNWIANGAGSSNTAGSITSTVSANTTAGFSVVTYTGTGANATVGHGLGVAPSMIIVKNAGDLANWRVYHSTQGATKYLVLNTTDAVATASTPWNDTSPTSTVFSVGTDSSTNQSTKKIVAYCFAPVAGYSAFGSFTGNGSTDGPFVFTNHRPAFLLVKRTDSTSNWTLFDFKRAGYNVDNDQLYPNLSNAEATTDLADILSNGFKLRSTDTSVNASGGTYIYMSVAENPFKYSLGR